MTTEQLFISGWNWSPWVLAVCAGAWWLFIRSRQAWLIPRAGSFYVGLAVFFLALCSPLDGLANGFLFSAHMLQHLLLLLIVPLLILAGLPEECVLTRTTGGDGAPRRPRRRAERQATERTAAGARLATLLPPAHAGGDGAARHPSPRRIAWRKPVNWLLQQPLLTWSLGIGGMWLWHAPALCNAAVSNPWVHRLQYVSLLLMGFAFWWPVFGPSARPRLAPLAGILYLFSGCLGCTILGIIITFSPVEVCPVFLHPVDGQGILPLIQNQWGLTAARDQQLGGLLMWVPACLLYFFCILHLLARWYRDPGRETIIAAPLAERPCEQ